MLCRAMLRSCRVVPSCVMSCGAKLCNSVSCRVVPTHVVSCCAKPCHAMSCGAKPCCAKQCRAKSYCAKSCKVVSCHAHVVPSHVMACCVMPCETIPSHVWAMGLGLGRVVACLLSFCTMMFIFDTSLVFGPWVWAVSWHMPYRFVPCCSFSIQV